MKVGISVYIIHVYYDSLKKVRKESLTEVIVDAASKALQSPGQYTNNASPSSLSQSSSVGISPGKAVDLRSKNLQQLHRIQQLFDDNILSEKEFIDKRE